MNYYRESVCTSLFLLYLYKHLQKTEFGQSKGWNLVSGFDIQNIIAKLCDLVKNITSTEI